VPELTPVEHALVAAVGSGELLNVTGRSDREIRAEVVRDVLLGRIRTDPDPRGLRLRGAVVMGRLDLDGMRTTVRIRMRGCTFAEGIWLRGAALPLLDLGGSAMTGLLADDVVVEGSALLWQKFAAAGLVSLVGARIGGKLDLSTARLDGQGGAALVADRMTVGSDLLLDDVVAAGGAAAGTLQLTGTRVGGRLSARRIEVVNPAGPGISGANLHVQDVVDLSKGADVTGSGQDGAVRLVGAQLGSLSLGRATLMNRTGWAVAAHYLDVAGTLYLDRVRATGGIRISGGRIGGQLTLEEAEVDGGAQPALAGTRLQVGQAILLDGATLTSAGEDPTVNLRSARIAGDLDLRHTRLSHPTGTAFRLNTATVEGRMIMSETVLESGDLDFRDSTVGQLYDAPERLPAGAAVEANGLVYRGLPGHPGVTVRQRLDWLGRMPGYAAQPYRQLAAAYQAAGHPDDARRLLVAQQEHLRRSGALTGWSRLRHRLFGLTLQYGYQPLRAVALLAATLAAAALLFGLAAAGTRTEAGGPCPGVDRVGLAIDAAIPLVSTGAADRCQLATATGSGQALAAAGWVLTLLGWGSATLVVAGYTGLVRRS
jgi:hypothetical protein